MLLTPISEAFSLTANDSLPLVSLPSLISHVPSAIRQSTHPGWVAPAGAFQTTVSVTVAPGRIWPKSHVSVSLASKVPQDAVTRVALAPPGPTGGGITYLDCVKTEPLSFLNVALYAMFSPYVTAPGPGTASRVPIPFRFPALPPATAIAAPITATHATTRRPRVRFIVSPSSSYRSDACPNAPRAVSCQTVSPRGCMFAHPPCERVVAIYAASSRYRRRTAAEK